MQITLPKEHGCKSRGMPPTLFMCIVQLAYPKLGISERDDLFFGLHFILGKKLGICGCVNFARLPIPNMEKWSILLNHPPNAQHRFALLQRRLSLSFTIKKST